MVKTWQSVFAFEGRGVQGRGPKKNADSRKPSSSPDSCDSTREMHNAN